jgi:hypothetical protein
MASINENYKIHLLARDLGIKRSFNPEERIREYCFFKVEKFLDEFVQKDEGTVGSLDKLLEITAAKLGLMFEEVHSDDNLHEIKNRYVAKGELAFLEFMDDFNDDTDAVLVELKKSEPWEPKFAAIIDCRGYKSYRAYFSKWHEIAHLLSMPSQMKLPFRRTRTIKKDPEEILMDKIAGDLGFYSPLFLPEVRARTAKVKRLTFSIVDELKREVCPIASFQVTMRAAVERVNFPCLFIIAGYGLKKQEERMLKSKQNSLFPEEVEKIVEKFRAKQIQSNNYARQQGMLIFKNMEVPKNSVIFKTFESFDSDQVFSDFENLNFWKSSKGCLADFDVYIEAKKMRDNVWALINAK